MNRLFWGFFFCLLDVKFTVGRATFELLPDFIGYLLVMKGMEELAGENKFFDRGRHGAFGMVIVSLVLYGADLMDPDTNARVGLWVLELAALIGQLVILRAAISGIGCIASDYKLDLRCERLWSMWLVLAVLDPICHLLSWVPLVGSVCKAASLVTGACFLLALFDTRKRFCAFDRDMRR